jgi:hypothetical protein
MRRRSSFHQRCSHFEVAETAAKRSPRKSHPTSAFERVRRAAIGLADVTEGTSWGVPALKVRGTMFVCTAVNRAVEPNTLVARLSFVDRDWLLTQNPDVYYLKPHYLNYPCVLARLGRIKPKELRELVVNAREFVLAIKRKSARKS